MSISIRFVASYFFSLLEIALYSPRKSPAPPAAAAPPIPPDPAPPPDPDAEAEEEESILEMTERRNGQSAKCKVQSAKRSRNPTRRLLLLLLLLPDDVFGSALLPVFLA